MTPKQQILARYPDAVVFKSHDTQEYELYIKSRSRDLSHFVVWNCATANQCWKHGLDYLDRELLRKLES